jgi:hypothetical protein
MKAKLFAAAVLIAAAIPTPAVAGAAPSYSGNGDPSPHFTMCGTGFLRYPCWAL